MVPENDLTNKTDLTHFPFYLPFDVTAADQEEGFKHQGHSNRGGTGGKFLVLFYRHYSTKGFPTMSGGTPRP
jgi:hypothetical protein